MFEMMRNWMATQRAVPYAQSHTLTLVLRASQVLAAMAMQNSAGRTDSPVALRDLSSAPTATPEGRCTWEALTLSSGGTWEPSTRYPRFNTTCPYMKERYKCDWDRAWKHERRWIPRLVKERKCFVLDGIRGKELAQRLGRRPNILILGNSLLRELYETIVCEHQDEVVH